MCHLTCSKIVFGFRCASTASPACITAPPAEVPCATRETWPWNRSPDSSSTPAGTTRWAARKPSRWPRSLRMNETAPSSSSNVPSTASAPSTAHSLTSFLTSRPNTQSLQCLFSLQGLSSTEQRYTGAGLSLAGLLVLLVEEG